LLEEAALVAPAFLAAEPGAPSIAALSRWVGHPPGAIVFFPSNSGDLRDTRFAAAFFAAAVESTFRFRGSTAPVTGVVFGARPFFGRVAACLCFLPNRFLSSRCAITHAFFRHRSASVHYMEVIAI